MSYTPTNCTLEFDQPYTWRVRAVQNAARGPWSASSTFRAPAGGFIRGNEVYDPLTNGKTVGEIVGPVTFIPGVGVRLETYGSYIRYRLPETLVQGEFSLIITNVATNTEGGKTKVFAMSEGLSDIVTNDCRMTVEKRGDPEGIVAWRFISHEDQIDTEGAERGVRLVQPELAVPLDGDVEWLLQPANSAGRHDRVFQGQGLPGRLRSEPALRLHWRTRGSQWSRCRDGAGHGCAPGLDLAPAASCRPPVGCDLVG